jgi:hypothetical protein
MGSAQPRGHTVAQAFVQDILENAGERGDGDECESVVFRGSGMLIHGDASDVKSAYKKLGGTRSIMELDNDWP